MTHTYFPWLFSLLLRYITFCIFNHYWLNSINFVVTLHIWNFSTWKQIKLSCINWMLLLPFSKFMFRQWWAFHPSGLVAADNGILFERWTFVPWDLWLQPWYIVWALNFRLSGLVALDNGILFEHWTFHLLLLLLPVLLIICIDSPYEFHDIMVEPIYIMVTYIPYHRDQAQSSYGFTILISFPYDAGCKNFKTITWI